MRKMVLYGNCHTILVQANVWVAYIYPRYMKNGGGGITIMYFIQCI